MSDVMAFKLPLLRRRKQFFAEVEREAEEIERRAQAVRHQAMRVQQTAAILTKMEGDEDEHH